MRYDRYDILLIRRIITVLPRREEQQQPLINGSRKAVSETDNLRVVMTNYGRNYGPGTVLRQDPPGKMNDLVPGGACPSHAARRTIT